MAKKSEIVPTSLTEIVPQIDSALALAKPLASSDKLSINRACQMAQCIRQLRELITPSMIEKDVMPLQDTRLGFLTDRKDKGGYPPEAVRDCLIEALCHGVAWVGNQMNIIAGNCYITKEGYRRLVREFPGLTDLSFTLAIPDYAKQGARIAASASWKLAGETQAVEYQLREIKGGFVDERLPVKVNERMGVDAVLGKAERKLYARIYQQLTGSDSGPPEGDVDDIPVRRLREEGTLTVDAMQPGEPPTRPDREPGPRAEPAKGEEAAPQGPEPRADRLFNEDKSNQEATEAGAHVDEVG